VDKTPYNILRGLKLTVTIQSFVMFYRRYNMVAQDLLEFVTGKPNTRYAVLFWCAILLTPVLIAVITMFACINNYSILFMTTYNEILNWLLLSLFIGCCALYLYFFTRALLRVRRI
jgi:hypothetical protein